MTSGRQFPGWIRRYRSGFARVHSFVLPVIFGLYVLHFIAPRFCEACADDADAAATVNLVGEDGKARLWRITTPKAGSHYVMYIEGSAEEVGRQHGALFNKQIKPFISQLEFAAKVYKADTGKLHRLWQEKLEPYSPEWLKQEMVGLAKGSGLPVETVHWIHAIPTLFNSMCTCAAAAGPATIDGKPLMSRSLDYAINIGMTTYMQDAAVTTAYKIDGQIPHVIEAWAGYIGCLTGMNAKGLCIGNMTLISSDDAREGIPMTFLLREILARASTTQEAVDIIAEKQRDCGFAYMICDAAGTMRCVEATSHHMAILEPGKNDPAFMPFAFAKDYLVHANVFADPELAKLQREVFDPRQGARNQSWMRYSIYDTHIRRNYGKLTPESLVEAHRQYPVDWPVLQQAVYSPAQMKVYVANAVNPRSTDRPGAQDQTSFVIDLGKLMEGRLENAQAIPHPGRASKRWPTWGVVKADKQLPHKPIEGDKAEALLKGFLPPPADFDWMAHPINREKNYEVVYLRFSSGEINPKYAEVCLAHCEYYHPDIPEGEKRPAVVVVHCVDGTFVESRAICRRLAEIGCHAIMMQLPYYGDRRPRDPNWMGTVFSRPGLAEDAIHRAVSDVRRARTWLALQPDVDAARIGVCGSSLGGVTTALTAGVDGTIPKIVINAAGGDYVEILKQKAGVARPAMALAALSGVTPERASELAAMIDPLTYAHRVNPASVIMVLALRDELFPPFSMNNLWKAYGQPKITWYPCGHADMGTNWTAWINDIAMPFHPDAW
ncbi:MAG TPA: C45 family autoproteolytic acyltransferase/hydrolase [Candidatus Brocadiia bacterium]|nr:C45 family autoproteolytic acyltransferase/hydrolase [Candidatus Brocadiia bacterium]